MSRSAGSGEKRAPIMAGVDGPRRADRRMSCWLAGSMQHGVGVRLRKTTSVAACGVVAWIFGTAATVAAATGEEHGLSQKAVEIARPFGFPITNSMLVMWIVAAGLIIFTQIATRNMKQVPDGAQNFLEWLIEGLYGFLEGIIGPKLIRRTFWFFGSAFIFILAANWVGLIPGVGSMGWGQQTAEGFRLDEPFFRGANADVNLTLAMALVFFASWIVWGVQEVGPLGFLKELFAPKGESYGPAEDTPDRRVLRRRLPGGHLHPVPAGLVELPSLRKHLRWRNDVGDHGAGTQVGWLVQIPFYFMELLVGLVQALVFTLLTAVFTLLICQHHGDGTVVAHD